MLFMVIENFRPGQAPEVYRRFRDKGRMAPDEVQYLGSWVDLGFERCFQVMEAESEALLREWTAKWEDLIDFEIVPVRTSADAAAAIAPELGCSRAMREELVTRAFDAFRADAAAIPAMTLRGGEAVDAYDIPAPYDPGTDQPTEDYIEAHAFFGLSYLDPASWRHYLPRLIDYALRHVAEPGLLPIDAVLTSLRPPDREPPRLASLTEEQEAVVVAFLDVLAFDDASAYQDFGMQVLEEYWVPNALYRERSPGDD